MYYKPFKYVKFAVNTCRYWQMVNHLMIIAE